MMVFLLVGVAVLKEKKLHDNAPITRHVTRCTLIRRLGVNAEKKELVPNPNIKADTLVASF